MLSRHTLTEKEYFDNNYLLSAIILFTLNPLGIALGISFVI